MGASAAAERGGQLSNGKVQAPGAHGSPMEPHEPESQCTTEWQLVQQASDLYRCPFVLLHWPLSNCPAWSLGSRPFEVATMSAVRQVCLTQTGTPFCAATLHSLVVYPACPHLFIRPVPPPSLPHSLTPSLPHSATPSLTFPHTLTPTRATGCCQSEGAVPELGEDEQGSSGQEAGPGVRSSGDTGKLPASRLTASMSLSMTHLGSAS